MTRVVTKAFSRLQSPGALLFVNPSAFTSGQPVTGHHAFGHFHRNSTRLDFHQTQGMLSRAMAFQASMAKRISPGV